MVNWLWRDGPTESYDKQVIATVNEPFKADSGLFCFVRQFRSRGDENFCTERTSLQN